MNLNLGENSKIDKRREDEYILDSFCVAESSVEIKSEDDDYDENYIQVKEIVKRKTKSFKIGSFVEKELLKKNLSNSYGDSFSDSREISKNDELNAAFVDENCLSNDSIDDDDMFEKYLEKLRTPRSTISETGNLSDFIANEHSDFSDSENYSYLKGENDENINPNISEKKLFKSDDVFKRFNSESDKESNNSTGLITFDPKKNRVRDTLIHEMCHVAVWLIDGDMKGGHGRNWKAWANRTQDRFPDLPLINRCHVYEIEAKYNYKCQKCNQQVKRHSKSLDIERKICGYCRGKFVLFVNGKPAKITNEFALLAKNEAKIQKSDEIADLDKQFQEKASIC